MSQLRLETTMSAKRLVTTRNAQYALGNTDRTAFWVAMGLVLLVPLMLALGINDFFLGHDTPDVARQLASTNPRSLVSTGEDTHHFLPPPVPALPAQPRASAPETPAERARVANTGGVGAVLRAEPQTGRQIASLREGDLLQVLEKRAVGDADWLHVRTTQGAEGWISGTLVTPTG